MAKLFRLRDYILLIAAFSSDTIDEFRIGWGVVPSAMKNIYGFVPEKYKKASYLSSVSQMLSVGDIRRVTDRKGKKYLELTSLGENKYKRRFSIFGQNKKWDGEFMVVIFDIPEVKKVTRERVRSKLKQLGFGMLQKSIYISPYHFEEDLREFLIGNELENDVLVLSARKLFAGNLKSMSQKVWHLSDLNEAYQEVLTLVKKSNESAGVSKPELLNKAFGLYMDSLLKDPMLPNELLPDNWFQKVALKELEKGLG